MSNVTKSPLIAPGADLKVQASTFLRDSIVWIEAHWLNIAIAAGVAAIVILLLHAMRRWAMRLCERGEGIANWYSIIGRALAKTGNFFILMVALRLVSGYANPPAMVTTTITFLFTIAAVFQAAIWVREIVFGFVEHRTASETHRGAALSSALGLIRLLVSIALFSIALVVVLSNLGVNVTGLVAGLGVGGIAIGLAAQGIFADLFAALAIIFDKPFHVGDKVNVDGVGGVVERIGLKSTRIRAFTGEARVIGNKQLLDKEIQNISDRHHVRISLTVGVAYETPPEKLLRLPAIMHEIVEAEPGITVARASFEGFGASSVDFVLLFDVPGDDWPAAHAVRDKVIVGILKRFAAEGISIPYPTQTAFTAAPDGTLIYPYPDVQPVIRMDLGDDPSDAKEARNPG
ncbi:mechanosensitive ion channel family protein [Sphingomonas sp. M1-B02]|uniref:mechanosensitive ion channel family protein n=1 Tax=Sphingomonas sp. M1-B02 TaxID=3114300 RepID=UPI00224034A3|nr:mechanosensitive ion channel domain-containing protein [Sphingomonas sp. S6-11]UZK66094.1 mechanosensitive ion channel family protein [Sphingomonas sp. S6-11]